MSIARLPGRTKLLFSDARSRFSSALSWLWTVAQWLLNGVLLLIWFVVLVAFLFLFYINISPILDRFPDASNISEVFASAAAWQNDIERVQYSAPFIIALIGVPFLIQRSRAANKQAESSMEMARITSLGNIVSQLGATEKVGEDCYRPNIGVRVGALYSLKRLAESSSDEKSSDEWVYALDILSGYIISNASVNKNRLDVQVALDIASEVSHKRFPKQGINKASGFILENSRLNGARLSNKTLRWWDFSNATIRQANLLKCTLQNCDLSFCRLDEVYLNDARLEGVTLAAADLSKARGLEKVDMSKTYGVKPGFPGATILPDNLKYNSEFLEKIDHWYEAPNSKAVGEAPKLDVSTDTSGNQPAEHSFEPDTPAFHSFREQAREHFKNIGIKYADM